MDEEDIERYYGRDEALGEYCPSTLHEDNRAWFCERGKRGHKKKHKATERGGDGIHRWTVKVTWKDAH